MGNVLTQPAKLQTDLLADFTSSLTLKDTLGGGRFFKTLQCIAEGGDVVVKVYQKRPDTPSLDGIRLQLGRIKAALTGMPKCHVWPWQAWMETPQAAYLVRQHLAASLYDRLSTRPFLSHIEKRWIAFQLLYALAQAHEAGVCHGDLKTENVLLTSWNWLFVADWAPFKPTLLPEDNPADFSFYFDMGGRRRCYVAPERFYTTVPTQGGGGSSGATGSSGSATTGGGATAGDSTAAGAGAAADAGPGTRPPATLTPEMDVFSAGCVLAELFLDGRALFDLGTLLSFKRNDMPASTLNLLQSLDPELRRLVLHMTQLDAGARWSARQYLTQWDPPLFPSYFNEVLNPFFDTLLPLDTDARLAAVASALPTIHAAIHAAGEADEEIASSAYARATAAASAGAYGVSVSRSGEMSPGVERLEQLEQRLDGPGEDQWPAVDGGNTPQALSPHLEPATPLISRVAAATGPHAGAGATALNSGGGGMVLVNMLLCTLLRPSRLVESRRLAIQLVTRTALECDEEVRLQRCVPYMLTLLTDGCASVRCAVLASVVRLMSSIEALPPSDAKVFQDYLLPALSLAPNDPEEAVRVEYAQGISYLAEAAHRHMARLQHGSNTAALTQAAAAVKGTATTTNTTAVATGTHTPFTPTQTALDIPAEGPLPAHSAAGAASPAAAVTPHKASAAPHQASVTPGTPIEQLPSEPNSQRAISGAAGADGTGPGESSGSQQQGGGDQTPVGAIGQGMGTQAENSVAVTPDVGVRGVDKSERTGNVGFPHEDHAGFKEVALVAAAAMGLAEASGVRAEAELAQLRATVEKVVLELVTGVRTTPSVKRSLLSSAGPLATFYGRGELNNTLLPLIITCLNAQEWQLRSAFFHAVSALGPQTGHESLDVFLLPCLEQALADGEVSVVCDAVHCVASVTPYLRKRSLMQAARKVASLICHQSPAIRAAAISFMSSAARSLPKADVVAQLCPLVTPGHTTHPSVMCDEGMLAAHLQSVWLAGSDGSGDEGNHGNGMGGDKSDSSDDDPIMSMSIRGQLPGGALAGLRAGGRGSNGAGLGATRDMATVGQPLGIIHEQPMSGHTTPMEQSMLHSSNGVMARRNACSGHHRVPPWMKSGGAGAGGVSGRLPLAGTGDLQGTAGAGGAVDRLVASGLGGGRGGAGGGATLTGTMAGFATLIQAQNVPGGQVEMTAGGMVLHPHATLHVFDLPDPPPIVERAATIVALTEAGGGHPGNVGPSGPGSGGGAAWGNAGGQQGHPQQARGMVRMGNAGSALQGGGVVAEAVALLHPAASWHHAAISSIQPRVAALSEWLAAQERRVAQDPSSAEAAEKQLLARAHDMLARARDPAAADARAPSTLTNAKLAALSKRLAPPLHLRQATGNTSARPAGLSMASYGELSGAAGSELGPGALGALAAAMSTSVVGGGGANNGPHTPTSTHHALSAALMQLNLAALLSSGSAGVDGGAVAGVAAVAGAADGNAYEAGWASGAAGSGAEGTWRPRGVLVAHMMEHRRAITQIAVARGGGFAVTTSVDETAKPGALTSCAAVEDDTSVATGSASGTVHVWRVEVASGGAGLTTGSSGRGAGTAPHSGADRYMGVVGRRQLSPHMGAVLSVNAWGPHTLMYLTQHGGIHAWDLRVKQDIWRLPPIPSQGLLEHLALEPLTPGGGGGTGWGGTGNWLITGSSRGWLTVWDVRFMLPAHSWQHPARCAVDALAVANAPSHRLGIRPQAGGEGLGQTTSGPASGPLVYVAAGHQEVALWDVAASKPVQVLRCMNLHEVSPGPTAAGSNTGMPPPAMPVPGALQPSLSPSSGWLLGGQEPQQQTMDSAGAGLLGGSAFGGAGSDLPGAGIAPDGSVDVLGVARLAKPTPRPPGVRCVLPMSSGLLLTGSTDRCIRCWDGVRPESSYLVAGPLWSATDTLTDIQSRPPGLAIPQYKYSYQGTSIQGVPVLEEWCSLEVVARFTESSQEIRQMMRVHDQCHGDALTHMTTSEGAGGGRLLVTAARDGSFKAWK